jgi:hypothetical protein
MKKTQKVWTMLCLIAIILSETLIGGIASTFLSFNTIFGAKISEMYNNHPFIVISFLLPEIVAVYGLMLLNQQYHYKHNFIKYILLLCLLAILIALIFFAYVLFSFRHGINF